MNKNVSVGIPMKKTCGCLTKILFSCIAFLLMTGTAYAQSAKVTLNRKKVSVREVLNDIERQTDYLFLYNNEQLDFDVSVDARNESVRTVLDRIFAGTPIRFALEGKHIVLRKETQRVADTVSPPAKRTVTGTVSDSAGKPIVGAAVLVKGGTVGTTTDIDGRFSLTIPAGSELEVSFLGYVKQEVAVGGRTTLDIRLAEDATSLD